MPTYKTDLTVEECLQRLTDHTSPFPAFNPWQQGLSVPERDCVFSKIKGNRLILAVPGPKYIHHPFGPAFYGKFAPHEAGAIIRGKFRMHTLVRVFTAMWLGVWVFHFVFILLGTLSVIEVDGLQNDIVAEFGFLLVFFFVGFGAFWFGKHLSKGQVTRIRQYLEDTLEARLQS